MRDATVFARTSPEHKLRLVEALQARRARGGDDRRRRERRAGAEARRHRRCHGQSRAPRRRRRRRRWCLPTTTSPRSSRRCARAAPSTTTSRKLIGWTLPTDVGEAHVDRRSPSLFGLTLPITAVQILWVNMVTTVALGLTLAFEPTEPGTMSRPPRPAGEPLLTPGLVLAHSLRLGAGGRRRLRQLRLGDRARPVARDGAHHGRQRAGGRWRSSYLFSVRYVHGPR